MKCALLVLRQVYTAARRLWPAHNDHESMVVKIDVAALKTKSLEQFHENASDLVWILAKQNEIEGSVKLINVKEDASVLKLIQHAMLVIDVHQPLRVFDAPKPSLPAGGAELDDVVWRPRQPKKGPPKVTPAPQRLLLRVTDA